MQNFTEVKLEIFTPKEHAFQIRDELAKIGVGVVGDYDHCMALMPVKGYFRPTDGATPFIGQTGEISEVDEYKIEINCQRALVEKALKVIRMTHPYEEPLINIIPVANHLFGS